MIIGNTTAEFRMQSIFYITVAVNRQYPFTNVH